MINCIKNRILSLLGHEPDLSDWQKQYGAVFTNMPVGIAFLTRDMRYIRINPFLEERLGLVSKDIEGRHCYDVVGMYKDDPARVGADRICDVCGVKKALETGQPFKFTRRSQDNFIVENMGVPIKNKKGEIIGAAEIIMDVTERVRMEDRLQRHADELAAAIDEKTRELRRSRSFLNNIIESTRDAIFTLDRDARINFVNTAACVIFGLDANSLSGVSLPSLLSPEDAERVMGVFTASGESGRSVYNMKVGLVSGGASADLLLSISPLSYYDTDNLFVCICKDVTHETKLEHDKEEFMAMLTHDLKTPLTAILGYSSLILNNDLGPVSEAVRLSVGGIQTNSDKMLRLVGDFLSVGKIDATSMPLSIEPLRIEGIVHECMKNMGPIFDKKAIRTVAGIEDGLPVVHADRRLIERVVNNLLSNAAKYASHGDSVEVRVFRDNEGFLALEVNDSGKGIPEEDMAFLFDKYYQGTSGSANGGTGLGLYISKSIVEAHDGSISARNRKGGGASFKVKLPVTS